MLGSVDYSLAVLGWLFHQSRFLMLVLSCSSQRGELIPPSNPKFSAGSDGSLYVVSPGGEESGEYICTATNAAGYVTRKVQLTVYGKEKLRVQHNMNP